MKQTIAIEIDGLPNDFLTDRSMDIPTQAIAQAAIEAAKLNPEFNERIAAGDVTVRFLPEISIPVDPSQAATEDPSS